ncbi:hypothetical protein [Klebsiella phage vB_KpnS_Uniso31]|uniref:Uncharacterized protein n=1 Tax=Klebsiella phage vB_KpnS_Uniso31 TaxID=2951200 RepID=A0A9E7NDL2_9CAUD|nr:hypothetical protein [Klebsiella phage vB_KpnS_Uniso31]
MECLVGSLDRGIIPWSFLCLNPVTYHVFKYFTCNLATIFI